MSEPIARVESEEVRELRDRGDSFAYNFGKFIDDLRSAPGPRGTCAQCGEPCQYVLGGSEIGGPVTTLGWVSECCGADGCDDPEGDDRE